jgi:serine/threonine protein kinase
MPSTATLLASKGWRIGNSIGQGGQAKVFEARRDSESGDRVYALKLLERDKNSQAYKRFHNEIDALMRISHPGIITVHDHGSVDNERLHYYVMQFVPGAKALKHLVATNDSPFFANPLKSLAVYTRLLEALAQCERANIVHRDLSLGNVLVGPEDSLKLIDFGCCHFEDGQSITLTDEAVGTPGYRAPECEGFSTAPPSIRSDLYSAGKLLWSIVTNKKAFQRESPVFDGLSLARVLPDTPMSWHLQAIFERTIRKDPMNRYATVSEALEAAARVQRRIDGRFLPLEILYKGTCPICGVGKLLDGNEYMQEQDKVAFDFLEGLITCYVPKAKRLFQKRVFW